MRIQIGPIDLTLGRKSADLVTTFPADFPGRSLGDGWFSMIRESFSGAWQRNIVAHVEDALAHPTFWACVTLIAGDVAKLRPMLMSEDADGIETEIDNPAYSPVLRRPNHYQNRIQFYSYWMLSKVCRGNAYALKERDNRGVVTALYLLDPIRVRPMVTPSGDVYYSLGQDLLSGVGPDTVVVPAREIIHDIMYAPYHPLIGMGAVYASGQAAMQALQIVSNSTRLARNGFSIGGLLLAPGQISETTAAKLEKYWEENYGGADNTGRIAVLGDGLKFEKTGLMSAVDAEVIKQLQWDDEKICSTLHVPAYMVGVGPAPNYSDAEALNQYYYGQCLQLLIESLELCLTEGLDIVRPSNVQLDIDGLFRMDSVKKMTAATAGVKGGIYTPNEGRKLFNRKPLTGGDTVFLQEQDHSLQWLAARDAQGPPKPVTSPVPDPPALPAAPVPAKDATVLLKMIVARKAQEAGLRAA